MGAGHPFSDVAGETAAVVKLFRVAMPPQGLADLIIHTFAPA
jgi:uncharacterized membrane protein YadS